MNRTFLILCLVVAGCATRGPTDKEVLASLRDTTYITLLGSYDEEEQKEAINVFLTHLDQYPEEIAKVLSASLKDPVQSDRTKLVASCILARIKDERGIPALVKSLGANNEGTQELARRHLKLYGSRIIPVVADALETGDVSARLDAAEILSDFGTQEGYDIMWRRYEREPDPEVRFMLLVGIAQDTRTVARTRLLEALSDSDELDRDIVWGAFRNRERPPPEIEFDAGAPAQVREKQLARVRLWVESLEP